MNITIHHSSSAGNLYRVDNLLIEAGVSIREIQEEANQGPVIDIEPEPDEPQTTTMTDEEIAEALELEQREAEEAAQVQEKSKTNGKQARVPGF